MDDEMAADWIASLTAARDAGQAAEVVRAAVGAAPHLRRLERWRDLAWVCDTALGFDRSPSTVALLQPFVQAAAEGSGGLTERALHARVVAEADRERGLAMSRELLADAVAAGDFHAASWTARDVSDALRAEGRLDEALALARQASEHTARAGFGPWTRAAAQLRELRIRSDQGDDRAVLEEVRQLLAGLPETSDEQENTTGWHVRGMVLELGSNTAATLGDHATAVQFVGELLADAMSRNAAPAELAKIRFVLATRLVQANRNDEARQALLWCRGVLDEHGDLGLLYNVIGALVELEDRTGNHSRAVELKAELLRFAYATDEPAVISRAHHDLGVLLGRVDNAAPQVLAHYLASAIIAARVDTGTLGTEIEMLAMFAFAHGLPGRIALEDMVALAEQTEGVRLGELLERLPQQAPDELQQIFDLVLERAGQTMEDWKPLMLAVVYVATGTGQPEWADQLEAELTDLEQRPDTRPMVSALRRVLAGERGPELVDGLGLLPSGIVSKVLDGISVQARGGS